MPAELLPVHQALVAVMDDVQAVSKDGRNQQQNFNFRGIDAVVNAVGPALRKHGVVVLPRLLNLSTAEYVTKSGTAMRMSTVEVEFTFVGPDGSTLTCSAAGEASDAGDKGTAKAHSVAFRTALLQALCIPTDEPDPDASSHERAGPPQIIAQADTDRIRKLIEAAPDPSGTRAAFRTRFGHGAADLPLTLLEEANDWLSDLEVPS